MLHLLPAWRGRRVLLAAGENEISRTMLSFLEEIGARPARIAIPCGHEALCRALQAGRGVCVIVPCLGELTAFPPVQQLAALHTLLGEAREAGTPLVMLLADHTNHAYSHALDRLMHYANEFTHGNHGDAVSIQGIWHAPMETRNLCLHALALGARYLMGDLSCTGIFTLPHHPQT